jgi:hypothetical protein
MRPEFNVRKNHQHKPLLPGNQIRLIILYPAKHLNASINCSLLQTSLDNIVSETSPYEALSYTWGPETREHEIVCDGKKILVPKNCQLALRYLRYKSQTRTLWVDAICIKQSSVSERNHHVRLMADLYTRSKNVLIWVGEGDAKISSLIRRVALVGRYLQFLKDHATRHPRSDAAALRKICTSKLRLIQVVLARLLIECQQECISSSQRKVFQRFGSPGSRRCKKSF